MAEPQDRRYRYSVSNRSGGWYAYFGGMATDDMWPVCRDGKPVLFPTEPAALRAAFDGALRLVQKDILAFREASQKLALKRPSPQALIQQTFGDSQTVYPKPNKPVRVHRKRRRGRG